MKNMIITCKISLKFINFYFRIKKLNRVPPPEYKETVLKKGEFKKINFKDKLVLAPLTTLGNIPFRRSCLDYGVDITCGEMALANNIISGKKSEIKLLRRHKSEKLFGIQVTGAKIDTMIKLAQVINNELEVDWIDINSCCPIDLICNKQMGCRLMSKPQRLHEMIQGMKGILNVPISLKIRMGEKKKKPFAHNLIPKLEKFGADAVTLHARSKQQRYSNEADWNYIGKCAKSIKKMQFLGNGDVFSHVDYKKHLENNKITSIMIGRGALIKPWIFKEIREEKYYDISSSERLDMLKNYVKYGLEHYGSDLKGIETTRIYLLELLSFLYRYIPVGLLEVLPQKMNERPPKYYGRNELETLFSSNNCNDWIKITELLLPKVPTNFKFTPKHKSNSYNG